MPDDLDFSLQFSTPGHELLEGTGKLGRVGWLSERLRRDDLFFFQDGTFSRLLFNEALECFVGGQFIACIVVGFSFIERSIAGRLSHIGENSAAKGDSRELLDAAQQRKWITKEEQEKLDELRWLRNPIVHFKGHLTENRPEIRATRDKKTIQQMLEADAKEILEASIHMLTKTAF